MKTRVLYVEDEPFLARIVKESLESRDFEVVMLDDGKNAIDVFAKISPDICVFDIMLPSRSGYDIARGVRNINAAIPIIFVTAKTQTEDLVKGFESGGNDYIRKPFSMEELIIRINNLLMITKAGKKTPLPEIVDIGSYQFNPVRYELRLGEHVRKLSHKEAQLLALLSENTLVVFAHLGICSVSTSFWKKPGLVIPFG